jgi:hypothetical protein
MREEGQRGAEGKHLFGHLGHRDPHPLPQQRVPDGG